MNASRIEALLLEALDYDMGPVPQSLIQEALSLVNGGPVKCDGGRFYFSDGEIPWLAVLVQSGERYGRTDPKTGARWLVNNTGKPLIEFWDRRYPHDEAHGAQFVSRYYLSTFMAHEGGLLLDTGSPDWELSERAVAALQDALA